MIVLNNNFPPFAQARRGEVVIQTTGIFELHPTPLVSHFSTRKTVEQIKTVLRNMSDVSKLNNPVWHSLNEAHRHFALGEQELKLYPPNISPFVGINSKDRGILRKLDDYIGTGEPFFIIGDLPDGTPDNYTVHPVLICAQMIQTEPIEVSVTEEIIYLNEAYGAPLTELVNQVQPGYFRKDTRLMGDYFGIFKEGKLVAVAGERMCMDDFVEISAVVTHPDFTGRGYAKQLVAYTVNKNLADGITAYLHVAASNTPAIALYEKLGFRHRPKISVWKMNRVDFKPIQFKKSARQHLK